MKHEKKLLGLLALTLCASSSLHAMDSDRIAYTKPKTEEEFIERVKQAKALGDDLRKDTNHAEPYKRLTRVLDYGIETWFDRWGGTILLSTVGIIVVGAIIIGASN